MPRLPLTQLVLVAGKLKQGLGSNFDVAQLVPPCALPPVCAQVLGSLRRLTHLDLSGCDAITGGWLPCNDPDLALAWKLSGWLAVCSALQPCPRSLAQRRVQRSRWPILRADEGIGELLPACASPHRLHLSNSRLPSTELRCCPFPHQTRRLRSCCPPSAPWSAWTCPTAPCRTVPAPCWPPMRRACAGSGVRGQPRRGLGRGQWCGDQLKRRAGCEQVVGRGTASLPAYAHSPWFGWVACIPLHP